MWLMMSEVSVKSISEDLRSVFSKGTIERARRTRTNIENYYRWDSFILFNLFNFFTKLYIARNLSSQQQERSERLRRLKDNLSAKGLTDDEKQEKLRELAAKETEFLRLRRSKLGADDFVALKVIGKGAFGEVR